MKEIHNYLNQCAANNVDVMANLMEDWNVDRGADGEENVFILTDYVDFHYFATRYGVKKTLECCQINDCWFGGNNFEEPKEFPKTLVECHKLIDNCIDADTILNREDIYERYFDIDKLRKAIMADRMSIYLKGNEEANKELEYYVVLQWFSVVVYKAYENNLDAFKEDTCEDDIMDMIANLAYEFWSIHKKTAWETTFMDYVLHFLVNELGTDDYRGSLWQYVKEKSESFDTLIEWFKNQPNYWGEALIK